MTVLLLILSCMFVMLHDSFSAEGPFLQASPASGPIFLDGRLDDAAWQSASVFDRFLKAGTQEASLGKTSVRILYDRDALYIGIECREPDMKNIKCSTQPRDGGLYENDCLEIMLDPAGSKERYYQFMADARGQQYDSFIEQGGGVRHRGWNGIWRVRTHLEKNCWSSEIKIPFFNFTEKEPLSGTWGMNICRDKRTNPREDSSISGEYHKINRFLPLKGIDMDLSRYQLEVNPPAGKICLGSGERIFIENSTALKIYRKHPLKLSADSWLVAPDGEVFVSPLTEFTVSPGKSLQVKLPRIEIEKQGRYRNVLRVLDSDGHPLAYREAVQNIHFSPISILLRTPWYRHAIFETQKIREVEFSVRIEMEAEMLKDKILEVVIGDGDRVFWQRKIRKIRKEQHFKADAGTLPYGRYKIFCRLLDASGKNVDFCNAEQPLWKLPFKKTETWVDRKGIWHIEGKPFFINSFWADKNYQLPEHNLVMTFQNNWNKLKPGIYALSGNIIFAANRKPGMREAYQSGHLDEMQLNNIRQAVRMDRDVPNLFGYFLMDEPSSMATHVDALLQVYETIKEEDPYHPVVISDSPRNEYILAADINGHHPYPNVRRIPVNDCTAIADAYDRGMQKLGNGYHRTSFIFMDMGFNKWDFGLGPKDGRIATFQEYRDHMLMGLACGMKGLIPYNSNFFCYPEGTIGFPALAREGAWLGKAVISPDMDRPVSADSKDVRLIAKNFNDGMIIASNVGMKRRKVTFTGLPAGVKKVNVLGEERSLPVKNGSFTDEFTECQGHVYGVGLFPDHLDTVRTTKHKIEEAWKMRAKPGNLLFQRFKDDAVEITASSIFVNYSMCSVDSTAWHLCDGFFPEKIWGYGLLYWSSAEGKLPAWIQFKLKKGARKIGRVVIYPIERTVKEIEVSVLEDGAWRKVWKCGDATGMDKIEAVFPQVSTEAFRIHVISMNPNQKKSYFNKIFRARISEVEAYEK